MDLEYSAELDRFREKVRAFIEEKSPKIKIRTGVRSPEPEDVPKLQQWAKDMFDEGLLGAEWPERWGGRPGGHPLESVVVSEELARANSPFPIGAGTLAAGALIQYGTPEQQTRYLPSIRSGEDIWCQLFSEPNAGSDLASLQTRAVRDGDTYIVNGQKVWTTNGQFAHLGYLLARTDTEVDKHAGISAFALDMTSPGVEVRPLREITGTSDFNEVFLDNVVVPAENLIGKENDGWMVATHSLINERSGVASAGIRLKQEMSNLIDVARGSKRGGTPSSEVGHVRQDLARLHAEVQICNYLGYMTITRALKNDFRVYDAPIGKLFFSELNLALAEYGVRLQGTGSILVEGDRLAVDGGHWQDSFLYARAYTIAGGASEIMRNMISERGLGMPRDPKPAA